ncbi:MAG TPA: sterol desaturase, partial [Pseudomonas sp.]|nr:sterol desaturase [Pseudomonas sp.]
MGVSESFQHYVLDPILLQFSSLFDLNGRLGLLFLGVSYAVAYLLFRYRKRHGLTEAASFWRFLGGWQVHWHPSARLDYRYYFVRGVLKVALVVPVVALVDPYI